MRRKLVLTRTLAPARLLPYLALGAAYLALGNGAWFFAETVSIHGDALNGYASDRHYFVSSHGDYTEVAETTWQFSRMHALSFIATFLLGLASIAYLARLTTRNFRRLAAEQGRTISWFDIPTIDAAPPGIVVGLYGFGMMLGVALLIDGIFDVTPHDGGFGNAWTLWVAAILGVNAIRVLLAIRRSPGKRSQTRTARDIRRR